MKKTVLFREKLKSIKFVIFMLVYIPSVAFVPLHLITGTQFVSLMGLIVAIFTAGHEYTKKLENGNGEDSGNQKPPLTD